MLETMFDLRDLAPEGMRPLLRTEYERMVELGMFNDERVELLRGVLVTMSPQGVSHAAITAWLGRELILALRRDWNVFQHSPYAASDESEPEPDISVFPSASRLVRHPSNAVLLIEVSDSSIRIDRRIKSAIYAEARVPEYWVVDISSDDLCIEVHTDPTPTGYRSIEVLRDGDLLKPTQLPAIEIAVRDIPWPR